MSLLYRYLASNYGDAVVFIIGVPYDNYGDDVIIGYLPLWDDLVFIIELPSSNYHDYGGDVIIGYLPLIMGYDLVFIIGLSSSNYHDYGGDVIIGYLPLIMGYDVVFIIEVYCL